PPDRRALFFWIPAARPGVGSRGPPQLLAAVLCSQLIRGPLARAVATTRPASGRRSPHPFPSIREAFSRVRPALSKRRGGPVPPPEAPLALGSAGRRRSRDLAPLTDRLSPPSSGD